MRFKSMLAASAGALFLLLASPPPARTQGLTSGTVNSCGDDITEADGFKIRSVKFLVRYASLTPPAPGTPYSPVLRTQLTEALHDAFQHENVQEETEGGTEFQLLDSVSAEKGGQVGIAFVSSCVRKVAEADCVRALGASTTKCVDITMQAFSLRIDTTDPWSNLLHNARANQATFFRGVPGPLLALNPKFATGYDRRYGASGTFGISSNLFDLAENLGSKPLSVRPTRLDVTAQGSKSLQNSFYNTATGIALSHRLSGLVDRVALNASFTMEHNPLGSGDYLKNAAAAGGSVNLRLDAGPFSSVTLGGSYVGSDNRLSFAPGAASQASRENGFSIRAISDGGLVGGFSRLAVWVDGGWPDNKMPGSYRRAAGLFGYARDFLVAPNQTISLEAVMGGGGSWGSLPSYAQFFGGNSSRNFLYEAADSQSMADLPTGPLLRSLGAGQGTSGAGGSAQGGTSDWHANINLAFPIRKWSQPLIPDVSIDGLFKKDANCKLVFDSDGNPVPEDGTLGQILKSQGACSKNTLARLFQQQGLTAEEAKAKAEKELRSVNSILGFLADRANLVSLKPLVMFDAARIFGGTGPNDHTRYGLGGGVQFTVVIAKFEAGYMAGIRRYPSDPPGNFVVRLVFQNLF